MRCVLYHHSTMLSTVPILVVCWFAITVNLANVTLWQVSQLLSVWTDWILFPSGIRNFLTQGHPRVYFVGGCPQDPNHFRFNCIEFKLKFFSENMSLWTFKVVKNCHSRKYPYLQGCFVGFNPFLCI